MIGTRGIPARYGGFETAVEEVSLRLIDRGHEVTVYNRTDKRGVHSWCGVDVVELPAMRKKQLETLSHTFLSVLHARREPVDAAVVFNAANSFFVPILKSAGVPTALHMDGLEWQRSKWGGVGKTYYRLAEQRGVHVADALIADAEGIADYYRKRYDASTELIAYGAPIRPRKQADTAAISRFGVQPNEYHLVVARFEPENHVAEIVRGYVTSDAKLPLVVVGFNPYPGTYTRTIEGLATDERVRLTGGIWDQELLDALYANCRSYLHGHSVGGTNPSLLRAMGAGAPCIAWDVVFNREVLPSSALFFADLADLQQHLRALEEDEVAACVMGEANRVRASSAYTWDDVAMKYEALLVRLAEASK
jgi:glycosyltransferase involved in cell wall biosynthesis